MEQDSGEYCLKELKNFRKTQTFNLESTLGWNGINVIVWYNI